MGAVLAAVNSHEAAFWLVLLFIGAILAGAAFAGYHERWIACVCLIVVAIIAGALLL